MIDTNHQFENEQRARHATLRFLSDALNEPSLSYFGAYYPPNPEAALAYLIQEICNQDPVFMHKVIRSAWADYTVNPGKGRWPCIRDAARRLS